MFMLFVLAVIAYLWYAAGHNYMRTGRPEFVRKKYAYGTAFVGAVIGSSFGVAGGFAGMGGAVAATIPGALVGYLLASNLLKRDYD